MTTTDRVAKLLLLRRRAWDDLGHYPRPLGALSPDERRAVETASADFRRADREILAAVHGAGGALAANGVLLRETKDGLGWVTCDPQTGRPVDAPAWDRDCNYESMFKPLPMCNWTAPKGG